MFAVEVRLSNAETRSHKQVIRGMDGPHITEGLNRS